jgi:pimeloyl-ACP methyl ester carboxylesterase
MSRYLPWNSQPLDEWAAKHARGDFIDLDGHSTHYVQAGEGRPVILLHGFLFDWHTWRSNLDALGSRFKVYALDFWGFGCSTREPLDHGYPLYERQLQKFMDALDIPEASLIGHSMGGGVAIYFTVRHRARVRKLVLVGPVGLPAPLPPLGRIAMRPRVGEFLYGLPGKFVRKMTLRNNWFHDARILTRDYLEDVLGFHKVKGTTEVMLSILRKQFFHTLLDDVRALGQMAVPTLLIWGRQDKSCPLSSGQAMHRLLKGSRLEVFDRVGHAAHDEGPERFNQLALDFLSAA